MRPLLSYEMSSKLLDKKPMNVFEEFKVQMEFMKSHIKQDEYVRVDVAGIRAHQIICRQHKDGDLLLVHGIDQSGNEAVIVSPGGHFDIKLSVCKKAKEPARIGFKAAFEDKNAIDVTEP